MAGRILPIALATIAGISIAVATFDGEFKEQRRKRLEEEYKKETASVSALNSSGPSPMASSTIPAPSPKLLQAEKEESKTSGASNTSWSSTLGFWAWRRDVNKGVAPAQESRKDSEGNP